MLVISEQMQVERRTFLRQLTALQRAGLRSTLDQAIAARDLSEADQLVLQGRNGRDDAWARLAEAMGASRERTYMLQTPKTLPPLPSSVDSLLDGAYRTNPTLANLQATFGAAQSRAAAAQQLRAPTIYAYGYTGLTPLRDAAEPINPSYEAFGIALNVPIFSGGCIEGDVRIAFDGVQTAHANIGLTEHLLATARSALAFATGIIGDTNHVDAPASAPEPASSRDPSPSPPAVTQQR